MRLQTLGDRLDQFVAGVVAHRVVDVLEPVNVDVCGDDFRTRGRGFQQQPVELLKKRDAVGQPGQGVVQRFMAPAFPLRVRVPARAFWQLPLLAVAMALLAGLAGMRRVARSDPAMAFAAGGA